MMIGLTSGPTEMPNVCEAADELPLSCLVGHVLVHAAAVMRHAVSFGGAGPGTAPADSGSTAFAFAQLSVLSLSAGRNGVKAVEARIPACKLVADTSCLACDNEALTVKKSTRNSMHALYHSCWQPSIHDHDQQPALALVQVLQLLLSQMQYCGIDKPHCRGHPCWPASIRPIALNVTCCGCLG